MSVCEWFINFVLPLFCDVSLLSLETLESIRTSFALVVTFCTISLLIWLPYRWTLWLLRGGRKKKI